MGAKETGWFRLEGGVVQEMDLPLHESIQQRVSKGEIKRVANAQGDPWDEPAPADTAEPEDPKSKALHGELEAARVTIADLEAALAMVTKERDDLKAVVVEPAPAKAKAK